MKRNYDYGIWKGLFILVLLIIVASNYIIQNKEDHENRENSKINIKEEKEIGTWRYKGSIENGSIRLYNNVWGLTSEEQKMQVAKSYIYYKFDNTFGWEWNRPDPRSSNMYVSPIYPSVVIGTLPHSTTEYLPTELKNISSLTADVEYKYTKLPTGSYNLAYDIWLTDNVQTKKAEVMIWLKGGDNATGRVISDGLNIYTYYYTPPNINRTWNYHSFILQKQDQIMLHESSYHTVDIKALLDQLNLDIDWIIPSISLGNEVWRGSGRIEIDKFIININGNVVGNVKVN